jgi:hypothetical protein
VAAALHDIVAKAGQVDGLASEVANASREQTTGITQMNSAIAQMSRVTQDNAANAEETAAGAEELNSQSQAMKVTVGELMALVGGQQHGQIWAGPAGQNGMNQIDFISSRTTAGSAGQTKKVPSHEMAGKN